MSRELREAVRKARAQTGLGAGGAPLPRPPNLAEARRHVQDVQRAQHPQLPGQTPLLRRAKGAAYRAPKEPRGAVGGLRVVSGSSPVPRWKALEASYLRGEAGLSCAQGQRRRWDKPHSQDRAAQCFVRRRILEGTGTWVVLAEPCCELSATFRVSATFPHLGGAEEHHRQTGRAPAAEAFCV